MCSEGNKNKARRGLEEHPAGVVVTRGISALCDVTYFCISPIFHLELRQKSNAPLATSTPPFHFLSLCLLAPSTRRILYIMQPTQRAITANSYNPLQTGIAVCCFFFVPPVEPPQRTKHQHRCGLWIMRRCDRVKGSLLHDTAGERGEQNKTFFFFFNSMNPREQLCDCPDFGARSGLFFYNLLCQEIKSCMIFSLTSTC